LDVHRDTISVAVLRPDRDAPEVERIAHDEPSVRRLVARFPEPRRLRACYEAGPPATKLARLLARLQVGCQVIAPTLIPIAPGDRVKTDSRDCRRLARLLRAGELVAIRIPTVAEGAVRDLCRARADLLEDRTRARHRLSKFLLRHGRVWRGGATAWTVAHERWLLTQRFDAAALTATYGHYRAVLDARDAQLEPSRPTWPPGTTGHRSPTRWPALPPTGASPAWARSPWPARSATGAGSPPPASSWASAG
jgi:transposase